MKRLLGIACLVILVGMSSVYAQGTRNDRDGDGVINSEDRCPDTPGPRSNGGSDWCVEWPRRGLGR